MADCIVLVTVEAIYSSISNRINCMHMRYRDINLFVFTMICVGTIWEFRYFLFNNIEYLNISDVLSIRWICAYVE